MIGLERERVVVLGLTAFIVASLVASPAAATGTVDSRVRFVFEPLVRDNTSALNMEVSLTGGNALDADVQEVNVHLCRTEDPNDGSADLECWDNTNWRDGFFEGNAWVNETESSNDCGVNDVAVCRWEFQDAANTPPNATEDAMLTVGVEWQDILGNTRWDDWTSTVDLKKEHQLVTADHSFAVGPLEDGDAVEFLFWSILLGLSFWKGWTFLAVIFTLGWIRPLIEPEPVAFETAAVLTLVAAWAYLFALRRGFSFPGRKDEDEEHIL